MNEAVVPLRERILAALRERPEQRAGDLASLLQVERRDLSRCLSFELAGRVRQGGDYRWRLVEATSLDSQVTARKTVTEVGRLCRYYLDCIGQDMDQGVHVFAASQHGEPNYAELDSLPSVRSTEQWWNKPGVGRVLGKVRQDRGKLVAWVGYPVRLRRHRTPRWEGFVVEPVLLWHVSLPEEGGEATSIGDSAPLINTNFLRSVAMGDGQQLAEETARLADELGLGVPVDELPDIEDLVERLPRIRPDWDWKEELDPSRCRGDVSLAQLSEEGIYNRAAVLPGERSLYTQGLETELKSLGGVTDAQLRGSALGGWLCGVNAPDGDAGDGLPLLEVVPMNTEQRAAVRSALFAPHTVVTGPPGTGKSQVVTNLLINAAWRGMKVLFASKNNKAVDVVESRVNGQGNRPVLLRLGAREHQERLATYLTQLLAGNAGIEDRVSYEEALERHRALAAEIASLDRAQAQTLQARNRTDRLDAEMEEARRIFGDLYGGIDERVVRDSGAHFEAIERAVDAADRAKQGLLTRLVWSFAEGSRLKALADLWGRADEVAGRLRTTLPKPSTLNGVGAYRSAMQQWRQRIDLAVQVVAYKLALATLQQSRSFEDIALERARLADRVAKNSQRLWRDWVQLAPARLADAQRREVAEYAALLQVMTGADAGQVHASTRRRARELQARVMEHFSCWAVTSLSARGRVPFEQGYFDLVVIDEASQCDIASALPLLYRAKRSVVIGDPQQLRHISALSRPRDSELQHKHGLVDTRAGWMYSVSSLYDVASGVASASGVIALRDHHRSHEDIVGFSNRAFYEGRLRVATRYQQLKRPRSDQPGIIWEDVCGEVTRPRGGGACNRVEAVAVVAALKELLLTGQYRGTVGVVTPFRGQAQLLQELVQNDNDLAAVLEPSELLVDTVHKFQGDERDVMFFSPVVSNSMPAGAVGFLRSSGNLFNVAITRARGLLHVVGDRAAASTCGVSYLAQFSEYVSGLGTDGHETAPAAASSGPDYPTVARPDRVSDWERVLYRALYKAGLRPLPQYGVDQYDLDFALIVGERKLNIEVDGERYHRSWTGELCLRDQLRNQRLIEMGWEVRRFWVYEVRDQLDVCVRVVADWARNASGPMQNS